MTHLINVLYFALLLYITGQAESRLIARSFGMTKQAFDLLLVEMILEINSNGVWGHLLSLGAALPVMILMGVGVWGGDLYLVGACVLTRAVTSAILGRGAVKTAVTREQ
jgi:hypothetical protein